MVQVIPPHLKEVWDAWNIRGMVLLSLSIQTILIVFAPLRKRTPNRYLALVLWLSYLLADWSANFAIGLIAKNQGKELTPEDPPQDQKLMALWAPFLLLHLGGPDTITAYAIEDNALWHRHFLGLGLQAISGAYVVIQSLPNTLWVIILLLFISGTFKYLERTIALYLASSDKFRGSILKVSDLDSDETRRLEKGGDWKPPPEMNNHVYSRLQRTRELELEKPDRELTDLEILQFGFWFFNNFNSLMVNNIFSSEQQDESREFFSRLQHEEALKILEVELSFIYEGLYTKASVIHTWVGAATRTIALGSLLSAFCFFYYRPKKSHEFHGADIVITYTLFLVGIALDLTSFFMLLFSDWTFAVFSRLDEDGAGSATVIDPALKWFLGLKKLRWKYQKCHAGIEHEVHQTPFLLHRWAGRINQFNFIAYSVDADIKKIHGAKGSMHRQAWKANNILRKLCNRITIWYHKFHLYIRDAFSDWPMITIVIAEFWFMIPHFFMSIGHYISNLLGINLLNEIIPQRFVHSEPLTKDVWIIIYTQLLYKLQRRARQERSKTKTGRKGWAFGNTELDTVELKGLMRYILDVDYDRSLLLWHIATELCYQKKASTRESHSNREFSKIISDYMMYLLLKEPKLMSEVAGIGKIRFRDTLAEAKKLFRKRYIENKRDVKTASDEILLVSIDFDPRNFKGNKSKSVLFEAAALAKALERVKEDHGEEHEWKIVSKVWMELLFHAACNCDPKARMEQLSKGGELLNFVWLAMAHLGLGDQLTSTKETSKPKWT